MYREKSIYKVDAICDFKQPLWGGHISPIDNRGFLYLIRVFCDHCEDQILLADGRNIFPLKYPEIFYWPRGRLGTMYGWKLSGSQGKALFETQFLLFLFVTFSN